MDALELLKLIPPVLHKKWGASLDYNRFTLMDLRGRKEGHWKMELLEAVIQRRPTWLQITDSAIKYLHLNHERSYGCKNDIKDYVHVFALEMAQRYHLRLRTYTCHTAASYLLFTA